MKEPGFRSIVTSASTDASAHFSLSSQTFECTLKYPATYAYSTEVGYPLLTGG